MFVYVLVFEIPADAKKNFKKRALICANFARSKRSALKERAPFVYFNNKGFKKLIDEQKQT